MQTVFFPGPKIMIYSAGTALKGIRFAIFLRRTLAFLFPPFRSLSRLPRSFFKRFDAYNDNFIPNVNVVTRDASTGLAEKNESLQCAPVTRPASEIKRFNMKYVVI